MVEHKTFDVGEMVGLLSDMHYRAISNCGDLDYSETHESARH